MMPCTFKRDDGTEGILDLDAVIDVVNGYSGYRSDWTALIVFDPKSVTFVELRASPPDIRGGGPDEAQAVDASYLIANFGLSGVDIAAVRRNPARWSFVERRG